LGTREEHKLLKANWSAVARPENTIQMASPNGQRRENRGRCVSVEKRMETDRGKEAGS